MTGGRSRLLEGLSARNLATSGPRKVSIQHTFLIFCQKTKYEPFYGPGVCVLVQEQKEDPNLRHGGRGGGGGRHPGLQWLLGKHGCQQLSDWLRVSFVPIGSFIETVINM